MKKLLTLVLALVMALAIALPAMAFTTDTTDTSTASPFELDIYLVEYENDEFFGITSLPPANRGYAKNEIVAAVVELYVPKNQDLETSHPILNLSGKNVSLVVTDNKDGELRASGLSTTTKKFSTPSSINNFMEVSTADFSKPSSNKTFKFLFFAKVTADDASLTASLVDGAGVGSSITAGTPYKMVLSGVTYTIDKVAPSSTTSGSYTITVGPESEDYAGASIKISVDKNYKSNGMSIKPASATASSVIGVTVGGALGIYEDAVLKTSGATYNAVMDVYEDVVKSVFGMDYKLIGNYVRDSFFTGSKSAKTIEATVEIKPWTAHVTIPGDIVVNPPKTGDAANIVGFVMIVLAAAAVVAVKKVRA